MTRRQEEQAAPRAERRRQAERRRGIERRLEVSGDERLRTPPWAQQCGQFLTRFLFGAFGIGYFNLGFAPESTLFSLAAINAVLALFMTLHAIGLWHSTTRLRSVARWRLGLWLDLGAISFMVLADPNVPSPGYLAYIMVILGNGMRYGSRFFTEAVVGTFAFGLILMVLRFEDYVLGFDAGTVLFMLFCAIIVLYAYGLNVQAERTRRQLETEREVDDLTGLLNRRAFQERGEPMFRALTSDGDPLVVLFADLDGFKAVNDKHGHKVGDEVLAAVGRAIAGCVRRTDVAARYGGDEFVLMLPDTDLDRATAVARRLQETLAEWSRRYQVALSLSVGMGQFPQPGCDFKTALERVDQAMYQGRLAQGRGGIRRVESIVTH
jgi:diguanylate cyclase (GGDEF)-like protein